MTARRIDVVGSDLDDLTCPVCESEDLTMWAENGDSDLADWYECGCGTWGAILDPNDSTKTLTQNGYHRFTVEKEVAR